MKFKYGQKVKVKDDFYEGFTGIITDYEDVSGLKDKSIYRYFIMFGNGVTSKHSISEEILEKVK